MAKKIGDLTLKEFKKIKERCSNYKNCKECEEKDKLCCMLCDYKSDFDVDFLEQEIEVEEDE